MRRTLLIGLLLLCSCNLVTQSATPTPAVPTVSFVFPDNNVEVSEGTDLQIQLAAQDSVGVARVELRIDGTLHQEGKPVESPAVPVFTVDMNWQAEGVGLHAFEAIAYRLDGTAGSPALINVKVTPAQ